jgi:FlaA1/EpsC-like NDP-sugar epimerase
MGLYKLHILLLFLLTLFAFIFPIVFGIFKKVWHHGVVNSFIVVIMTMLTSYACRTFGLGKLSERGVGMYLPIFVSVLVLLWAVQDIKLWAIQEKEDKTNKIE